MMHRGLNGWTPRWGKLIETKNLPSMFLSNVACGTFSHMKVSKSPVAIQIVNGKTKVMAASDILPGCLQVPVFCRSESNYITPTSPVARSFHEVTGEVMD